MRDINLTIVGFTSNDEDRIPKWIDQWDNYPIIIVDNFSTDNSVDIIRSLRPDAKILRRENCGYPDRGQIELALTNCATDWVWLTIISEFTTERTRIAVENVILFETSVVDAILIYRQSFTDGVATHCNRRSFRTLETGPINANIFKRQLWLHDEAHIHFANIVNTTWDRVLKFDDSQYFISHLRSLDPYLNIEKIARYSRIEAKEITIGNQPVRIRTFLLKGAIAFVAHLARGWRSMGWVVFITAVTHGAYYWLVAYNLYYIRVRQGRNVD